MILPCTIFNLYLFIFCKIASEENKNSEDLVSVSSQELSFKLQMESLNSQTDETKFKEIDLEDIKTSIQQKRTFI